MLDCNHLCYRARYASGSTDPDDIKIATMFGFIRDVDSIRSHHKCRNVAFCWDAGPYKRAEIYPEYKAHRHEKEMLPEDKAFQQAVQELRKTILPEMGYKNIFWYKGFEGDDLIASLAQNLSEEDTAVIVSTDHDMFQLLNFNISIFNHKKFMTYSRFVQEYGVYPHQWAKIKAMSGCSSDNIQGITGVGEKTAIKYLRKELSPTAKAYQTIRASRDIVMRNKRLVRLPFEGTPIMELQRDSRVMYDIKQIMVTIQKATRLKG